MLYAKTGRRITIANQQVWFYFCIDFSRGLSIFKKLLGGEQFIQSSELLEASDEEVTWVLGTVYKTEGSAYRKAGAHMLIMSMGNIMVC